MDFTLFYGEKMKKKILLSLASLALISNLNAYELDGNLDIKWTGFKLASKVGVSGTFNDIKLDILKNEDLADFLKSAKVTIDSKSLESKDEGRNFNITSTLFSLASAKTITGTISSVDETEQTLVLDLVLNGVQKSIPMKFEDKDGNIVANGKIDVLDFDLAKSYQAFVLKCAELHENVSYSDVEIEFTLPYK